MWCITIGELQETAKLSTSNKYSNSNCKHMHIWAAPHSQLKMSVFFL